MILLIACYELSSFRKKFYLLALSLAQAAGYVGHKNQGLEFYF